MEIQEIKMEKQANFFPPKGKGGLFTAPVSSLGEGWTLP
jgi:hypothetical protein